MPTTAKAARRRGRFGEALTGEAQAAGIELVFANMENVLVHKLCAITSRHLPAVKLNVLGYHIGMPERTAAKGYHHGDLRDALIEATFAQVDKAGHESVSVAALAKMLGVSQPAYTRHFNDKDALLTAVAVKTFHLFSAVLREAVAGCQPADQLRANALAYVRFGRERPGLYQLMFGSPLLSKAAPDSELSLAARACFELLLAALEGAARPPESVREAIGVWASLHGIVQLERFHLLDGLRSKEMPIDTIVDDLLRGVQRSVVPV